MASSSNSEFQGTYDIFLSFRGLDTRKKFTDHLYEALKREKFQTFRDDDEIERGEIIKSELKKAIENSRMSIIVLSKNYANSMACLFEIQTILEQWKTSDHMILPVFYEVDPLDIKEQAKNLNFGKKKVTTVEEVRGWRAGLKEVASMVGMGLDFGGKKVTVEEVRGWRAALKEVASMAGMLSGNLTDGYEAKFIEEIVVVIKRKLTGNHLELEKNMQKLKIELGYLSTQENDINAGISSAMSQPWKRAKNEVEIWLQDVQQSKDDVQRLEQQVVGERNVSSSAVLGKHIAEKTQEVTELQEKGRVFGGLLIDELPTGRLLIPPMKDFVKSTKARNTENVWECLMNVEVRPIGVWGMGGVGKTTIMKHIHNELYREKGKFDIVYWVTVSKAFSITKLQSDIAKALNLTFRDDEDETIRASELYAAFSRIKNYVLILDDLWEAFPLARVGIPEPTQSNGCKIVLTTRSLDVCRKMDCTTVKVELLTEQEALTLFLRKAVENDTVLTPEVEVIAAKIAKECACLPLAVVTVAGSLRGLKGTREWRNALNELISSTKDASDDESEVFEQLKFSYSRLGNMVLQDCFLYCSLYPVGHDIPVDELIEYWTAEGLIAEMNSVEAKFDKGHTILGKLTSSCLLESFTDGAGEEWVSMHDLIRDMARRITRSCPRFMVKAGEGLENLPYEEWSEDLDRISFMYSQIRELPIRPPVCPRLTTLLLCHIHLSEIPDSFFTNMCCLKVLDLSWNRIKSLPKSISNLKNLHALILVDCKELQYVPSLGELKALEVLKLTQSLIVEVPEGIQELVNLRKLDLSENEFLRTFPGHKLRKLSKLQYLKIDETDVKVLAEDLLCLRQLKVVAVCFYTIYEFTKYVTSEQCRALEKYRLLVGEGFSKLNVFRKEVGIRIHGGHFVAGVNELVLPTDMDFFQLLDAPMHLVSLSAILSLKDARDLRRCVVNRCEYLESIFSSSSFSEDGQICLRTVESLSLMFLSRYRVFFDGIAPPRSIYFNLKELSFWLCDALKNIFPDQFLENFPNLRSLSVRECKNVEDIIVELAEMSDRCHHRDDSNTIILPKLQTLLLQGLPRLKNIYNGVMVCQSIEVVDIINCPRVRRLPLSLHMDGEQATAPPDFKYIHAEEKWWESLEWDDPLTKTILQAFLNRVVQNNKNRPQNSAGLSGLQEYSTSRLICSRNAMNT